MTDKKRQILEAATDLFAASGYAGASTARIARAAGVSEGLIFRHFGNKRGLLDAVAAEAGAASAKTSDALAAIGDPAERLRAAIDAAFATGKGKAVKRAERYGAIRAQLGAAGAGFGESLTAGTAATEKALADAFKALGYEDATTEARFLRCALDGIRASVTRGDLKGAKKLRRFVTEMYG